MALGFILIGMGLDMGCVDCRWLVCDEGRRKRDRDLGSGGRTEDMKDQRVYRCQDD